MEIKKAVEVIERFYGLESLNDPATREAWQTLKTAVLGTTPNRQCVAICARFDVSCPLDGVDGITCNQGCFEYAPRKQRT